MKNKFKKYNFILITGIIIIFDVLVLLLVENMTRNWCVATLLINAALIMFLVSLLSKREKNNPLNLFSTFSIVYLALSIFIAIIFYVLPSSIFTDTFLIVITMFSIFNFFIFIVFDKMQNEVAKTTEPVVVRVENYDELQLKLNELIENPSSATYKEELLKLSKELSTNFKEEKLSLIVRYFAFLIRNIDEDNQKQVFENIDSIKKLLK